MGSHMAVDDKARRLKHADLPSLAARDSGVRLKPPTPMTQELAGFGPEPEPIVKERFISKMARLAKKVVSSIGRGVAGFRSLDDLDRPTPVPKEILVEVVSSQYGANGVFITPKPGPVREKKDAA